MKKSAAVLWTLLAAALISCFPAVPVSAAEATATEIHLISVDSGYRILVPGYTGLKNVKVGESEVTAVVVETPAKDGGGYPVFEILADDPKAVSAKSRPGILGKGQAGSFEGTFINGRLLYAPWFSFDKELKDVAGNTIFTFGFDVYDKDGNNLFSVVDVNFMFVTSSAAPSGSKLTVDGKPAVLQAYTINGSSYFKLRDLAMILNRTDKQFQISWDSAGNAIRLTSKTAYTPVGNELAVSGDTGTKAVTPTQSKVYFDGKEIALKAYSIAGSNYFKLRDIGRVLDFGVAWDGPAGRIILDTSTGYSE